LHSKALLVIANISHSDESLSVSLIGSTGIATAYAQLDRNSGTQLKRADDALYLAKNKGQNQVQVGSKINASEVNVPIVDALTVNAF
jgi:PleD family two-component response regulator